MMDKKASRIRRGKRLRSKLRELECVRLCVHRTPRHIYAQVLSADGTRVLATASTVQTEVRQQIEGATGNTSAAAVVGRVIAEKARSVGIDSVAFDRSGFRYHGRVKALAEAARENGLQF